MTKSEQLTWVAIHDDKIVSYPNYIDIDRKKLKEFQIRDGDEVLISLKNPKKLFARLRSYDAVKNRDGELVPLSRCWIVGNSDPLEYYLINETGVSERFTSWGPIPRHEVEFRDDEK